MWTSQTFLGFIDNCAVHHSAAEHVLTVLRLNETAYKLAPKNILAKFDITHHGTGIDVEVSKQLKGLSDVKELLQCIVDSGDVPEQFMRVLKASIIDNAQFGQEMAAAGAMICWSSDLRSFHTPWNIDTVKQALANINEYAFRKSIRDPDKSDITHEAATAASPEIDVCSSVTHQITAIGQQEKRDTAIVFQIDKTELKRHSVRIQQLSDSGTFDASNTRAPELENVGLLDSEALAQHLSLIHI